MSRPFDEDGIEAHLGCYGLHLRQRETLTEIPFRTGGFGQFSCFRQNECELGLGVALFFSADGQPPGDQDASSGCLVVLGNAPLFIIALDQLGVPGSSCQCEDPRCEADSNEAAQTPE